MFSKALTILKSATARSAIATKAENEQIGKALVKMWRGSESPVHIGESTVFEGGRGVFACRDIEEGALLTFYGGVNFPSPPLLPRVNSDFAEAFVVHPSTDDNYTLNLSDSEGGYIMGGKSTNDAWRCGQLINHPPKGQTDNVIVVEFKWLPFVYHQQSQSNALPAPHSMNLNEIEAQTAISLINQIYQGVWYITEEGKIAHTPSRGQDIYWRRLCGVAIFASQAIAQGEELWLDYKLDEGQIGQEIANWYTPVSPPAYYTMKRWFSRFKSFYH